MRKGDGRRACDRLTRERRAGVAHVQGSPCDRAIGDEGRRQPQALAGYHIKRVQVRGPAATAILDGGGFEDRLKLEQVGRRWLISDAPGLGG